MFFESFDYKKGEQRCHILNLFLNNIELKMMIIMYTKIHVPVPEIDSFLNLLIKILVIEFNIATDCGIFIKKRLKKKEKHIFNVNERVL